MTSAWWITRVAKPAVWVLALGPTAWLVWGAIAGRLGANPIETITHTTGDWTLRFLLLALAITPLRRVTGWSAAIRFRRLLGLFAFYYATLHFLTWLVLDQFFDVDAIVADVVKRPFITAGSVALLALLPLAVTSTAGWIRRLGGRSWQRLHRLAYLAAVAGVVHFYWLVKADTREPLTYAAILAVLLGARLLRGRVSRRARQGDSKLATIAL
jgi:sulfoxide reductase heme-binding subunit YedZ